MERKIRVLIVDAQGGGIGKQLISAVKEAALPVEITAVGTNTAATAAMLKAGAHNAATGENVVIVGCRKADVIAGPIGIVIADALLGEITPRMALAIGQSNAQRILVPVNHCDNIVVGAPELPLSALTQEAARRIAELQAEKGGRA